VNKKVPYASIPYGEFNVQRLPGLAKVVVFGVCFATSAVSQFPSGYEVTQIVAPFPGTIQTSAWGINDLGWIVGNYSTGANSHGYILQHGKYTSFDVPGATYTVGYGLNIWGMIVGRWIDSAALITHGFMLSFGHYTAIDFPGASFTFPQGINARGDVVGWYMASDNVPHGFLFENGQFSTIDYPASGVTETIASGINDLGQIVGIYGVAGGTHSFIKEHGGFRNIDGNPPSSTQFLGNTINDRGQIAGGTTVLDRGVFYPFVLPFPGLYATNATGINDFDQIVGAYGTRGATVTQGAFLLTPKR